MKSKSPRLALATAVLVALAGLSQAQAADIIPVITDPAGFGYNETTPVDPVGGNPGTTRGAQRQIVARYAAALWGNVLQSNVPIFIQARFLNLAPNVLGSAGATFVNTDFPNAPFADTWYHTALADSLAGVDLVPNQFDIQSQFSTNFTFYYGLDGNTPAGQVNFLDVVMHEYAHGLGFSNFENEATGTFFNGRKDAYSIFTYDNTVAKFWPDMTISERMASGVNDGNVVFTGALATAGAKLLLSPLTLLNVTAPPAIAGGYRYGAATFGPAATSANFSGAVVLGVDPSDASGASTTDGCSPLTSDVAGKIALIDRGTCGFVIKVKNAQNAGATAVIIADNAAGQPAGLGGADPTITIPSVRVSLASGNAFKANLAGMQVSGFSQDSSRLTGADALGRPQLFMPNPVQGGSSGSHYDSFAAPNLLMEPAINSTLRSYFNLDITPALFADLGWKLNPGNAKIGTCDTGVDAVDDAGIITGANVVAQYEVCKVQFPGNKLQYTKCMTNHGTKLRSMGLINSTQHAKVVQCTSLN
ncbi:MAG: PA domain-containing protein [Pseudomonadota bacterium]